MSFMVNLFGNVRQLKSYKAGETIFEQGESNHEMYIIKEGEVDVYVDGVHIDTCDIGTTLGELALIDKQPHTGTAVARTDCELVAIDEDEFLFLVQQTPYFALHMLRLLTERLRQERNK